MKSLSNEGESYDSQFFRATTEIESSLSAKVS